jgi:hypothetical protein
MVDLQAVAASNACWRKRLAPAKLWSEASKDAFDRAMAEHSAIHRRLTADKPL